MAFIGITGYTNDPLYESEIETFCEELLSCTSSSIIEVFKSDPDSDHLQYVNDKILNYSIAEVVIILRIDDSISESTIYTDNLDDEFIKSLLDKLKFKGELYSSEGVSFPKVPNKHYRVGCMIESASIDISKIVAAFKETIPDEHRHGWCKNENGWWFRHRLDTLEYLKDNMYRDGSDLSKLAGFIKKDIHYVHKLMSGELVHDDYYHGENGYIQCNQFITLRNKLKVMNTYYATDSGKLAKGWILINDKWHLFDKESGIACDTVLIDGVEYQLSDNGMLNEDKTLFELDEDGTLHKIEVV